MDSKVTHFKPRARLMLELGEQLIKNESVAILELVKNSYDAIATHVEVGLWNLDEPDRGKIIIRDNGIGMSKDVVINHWMEPATLFKKKIVEECRKYIKHNEIIRVPLGEKGIGRFGAHKLGDHIKLVSKAEDSNKEVFFEINWKDFDNDMYLDEVGVHIFEREPEVFIGNETGTLIEIDGLRHEWKKGEFRHVYKNVLMLNSPFKTADSFDVKIDTDHKEWIADLEGFKGFVDKALYKAHIEIDGNIITDYRYEFCPWEILSKATPRISSEYKGVELCDDNDKPYSLASYAIGKVSIDLNIFDLDAAIISLGFQDDKRLLKEYLKQNGGIGIYRDNMRLYEYGEAENDWLGLGDRRINNPTKAISGRIVVGAVYLNRLESQDLVEKTSREGFIENEAYKTFVKAVLFAISCVENDRMLDKSDLRLYYSGANKEPVIDTVEKLLTKIDKTSIDERVKEAVKRDLNGISREYKDISDTYIKSASLGLNMSLVIHEIDKILKELEKSIATENVSDHIIKLVSYLRERITSYSEIIKKTQIKKVELSLLVESTLRISKYRIETHKLFIEKNLTGNSYVLCADSLVRSALMNILDNAIYWLHKYKITEKYIYIGECEVEPGYRGLLIVDNGKGFTLPKEKLTVPFISKKKDGMGLGLHLANEIMSSMDGKLLFPDNKDLDIPEKYRDGAAVLLVFKEAKR